MGGGLLGAVSESIEKEAWMTSVMWGRAVVRWCAVVLGPPQMTRFPFFVHLAADSWVWGWDLPMVRFKVAQMSEGIGRESDHV
jgi:hypothetical protein